MGALQVIAKLERTDPEAARVLARLATWEWLADEADAIRPTVVRALNAQATARAEDTRHALVKTFITKRMAGADEAELDAVLRHAAHLTAIEGHIAKDDNPDVDNAEFNRKHKRDEAGRFMSVLRALAGTPNQSKTFADAWTTSDKPDSTERQAYNRMKAGGTLLESLGGQAKNVGEVTRLVGEIGPQAERVLGPGIRRTAYRYRGTERTPNLELRQDVSSVSDNNPIDPKTHMAPVMAHFMITEPDQRTKIVGQEPLAHAMRARSTYDRAAAARLDLRDATTDTVALHLRSDMATNYLIKKIPNLRDAEASLASGRVPPSRGVLIDREGNVVSEAVGFNGDHYLPFDLKNLGALAGGQYVRTRLSGGPSTEDIYTGLATGSRAMTVVSNAGVFTVEFDPDLRGGKRYADSARAMVDRYAHLLEAIGGKKLARIDIDPAERNRIKYEAYSDVKFDAVRGEELFKERIKAKMAELQLQNPDEIGGEIARKITAELERMPAGTTVTTALRAKLERDIKNEVLDSERGAKVQMHRLDGEGYYAALRSLKQEFPQYVRNVSYEPLETYEESRGLRRPGVVPRRTYRGTDAAHVARGASLPAGFADRYGQRGGTPAETKPEDKGAGAAGRDANGKPAGNGKVSGTAADPMLADLAGDGAAGRLMDMHLRQATFNFKEVFGRAYGGDALVENPTANPNDMIPPEYARYVLSNYTAAAANLKSGKIPGEQPGTELPLDADKLVKGMDQWMSLLEKSDVTDKEKAEATEALGHIRAFLTLREPFAPAAENMLLHEPAQDPRPQPFPEILELRTKMENYDEWLKIKAKDDPKVAEYVEAGPDRIKQSITAELFAHAKAQDDDRARKNHEEELARMQLAWSFVHARALAEQAKAYLPAVSPGKAPPPSATGVTKSLGLSREELLSAYPPGHPLLRR